MVAGSGVEVLAGYDAGPGRAAGHPSGRGRARAALAGTVRASGTTITQQSIILVYLIVALGS